MELAEKTKKKKQKNALQFFGHLRFGKWVFFKFEPSNFGEIDSYQGLSENRVELNQWGWFPIPKDSVRYPMRWTTMFFDWNKHWMEANPMIRIAENSQLPGDCNNIPSQSWPKVRSWSIGCSPINHNNPPMATKFSIVLRLNAFHTETADKWWISKAWTLRTKSESQKHADVVSRFCKFSFKFTWSRRSRSPCCHVVSIEIHANDRLE